MSDRIKASSTEDLIGRFNQLLHNYIPLAKELADKLETFGKQRRELQAIFVELKERDLNFEEPESLRQVVEDALREKDAQTITNTGSTEP